MSVIAVVEGDTDIPVVHALARAARLTVSHVLDMGGKSLLDKKLEGFNRAGQGSPWLVLRDLDHDAECAPAYLESISLEPSQWMSFRIAVRAIESWLMADAEAMARFLRVRESRIPPDPDAVPDPTRALVDLARRSTLSRVKWGMVPSPGARAKVGPLYEHSIIEFASAHWDLDRACRRSASLRRARDAMREVGERWARHVEGDG